MNQQESNLDDDSLMPFGKFQGIKMVEVPAWWLLWFIEQPRGVGDIHVRNYITHNLEAIQQRKTFKSFENGK